MAGGPASGRSARPSRHALRPGRHRGLRDQSRAVGRLHLRPAGPRGDAAAGANARSPGSPGDAGCAATPGQRRGRHRASADAGRRHTRRARRGIPGVDSPRRNDLGLLRLCDRIQSRAVVPVLRFLAAMADRHADARSHELPFAGRGLHRPPAVRAEGPGRPDGGPLALDPARVAGDIHRCCS